MFEICDPGDSSLSATRIHDLRRLVHQSSDEPIQELWISIVNEEQVLLRGRCVRRGTPELAAQAIRRAAPEASIDNRIEIVAEQDPGATFRASPSPTDRKRRQSA
jgi:hypothetical protein